MNLHLPRRLATFLLIAACSTARAAEIAGISDKLKPFIEKQEISGAVTLVVTKEGVVHQSAVGESDVAARTPMKVDDVFWIASMTKPVTGVMVLMLQDEGKLNVDDPVAKYLPEFANVKTPSGKPANLTLKHLMTHTSGLAEATNPQQAAAKTLADLIPHFVAKPTGFEPGTQWRYSQSGINTLGRIVEVVSGQAFVEFLDKRLTGPLGMKDTTFYPSKEQQARLAKSYERVKEGNLKAADIFIFAGRKLEETDRTPLPNGGLFSTAADYGRFCQMLLNEGTLDGKQYLKPETVKLMRTVFTDQVTNKVGFVPGSGWGLTAIVVKEPTGVTEALSVGTFGHGGAYGTQAWIDPVKGRAYVLMVQRRNFPNADASDVRKAFQEAAAAAAGMK
jgi:CubicO group peptidase (beta-lactamase class C family)